MPRADPVVWITRAEPGATLTAERVRSLGFTALSAPLLTVHALDTPLDLQEVTALAFTSANGVAAFAARSLRRDFEVFTVGDATATAARAAGFTSVVSAERDGAALAGLIVRTLRPRGRSSGTVLAPGPKYPAVDLIRVLAEARVAARSVALYETRAPETLPAPAKLALKAACVTAALFHSARAADAFAHLTSGYDLSSMHAVGLSPACLEPLSGLKLMRRSAAAPREDALLDALMAALGKRTSAR